MNTDDRDFAASLLAWHGRHGRHDLPWQRDWRALADPYRVWLSEIMLQQTQVATVIPYYERFVARLPTLAALATADDEEVMALWAGLGYYSRARNLLRCAREIAAEHDGLLPQRAADLVGLPGIGRSTANAIAAFCIGERVPILDGNVKRVLCRYFGIDEQPGTALEKRLWKLAESLLPATGMGAYIQAQMDLGATVCTRGAPRCAACPLADGCVARLTGRTGELPTPRRRKALPERTVTLLVLLDAGRVLLEKRPPTGIWGGLWSLPELAENADPAEAVAGYGCRLEKFHPLPPLRHTFTHFRLNARPLLCTVGPTSAAMEPGRRWLAAAETQSAPLPAPIRGLVERVLSAFP